MNFIVIFDHTLCLPKVLGTYQNPLKTFLWTTTIVILPACTFAGNQLGTIDSPGDIMSANPVIAFLFLSTVRLIPVFTNNIKRKDRLGSVHHDY